MSFCPKIGCTLLNMGDVELAALAGFDYVEFMGKYLVSLSDQQFELLLAQLNRYSIRALALNAYCPPQIRMTGDGFNLLAARDYAKRCAQRASALGTAFVGIGSPNSRSFPAGYDKKAARCQMKEFLRVTAEEFQRYHITICLEPLAPIYTNFINYVREAAGLVREAGIENLKVVIDLYNMEQTGENPAECRQWMPYIAHAHISDDDGAPDLRSFLIPSKAQIHQKRIRQLYDAGYTGALTVELDIPIQVMRARQTLQIIRETYQEDRPCM